MVWIDKMERVWSGRGCFGQHLCDDGRDRLLKPECRAKTKKMPCPLNGGDGKAKFAGHARGIDWTQIALENPCDCRKNLIHCMRDAGSNIERFPIGVTIHGGQKSVCNIVYVDEIACLTPVTKNGGTFPRPQFVDKYCNHTNIGAKPL